MKFHGTAPEDCVEPRKLRSICPECQDLIVAAAMSQHINEDVVRHFWACESCGHEFRTTVHLTARLAENCCAA
jgi:RNase P subunit RPR2